MWHTHTRWCGHWRTRISQLDSWTNEGNYSENSGSFMIEFKKIYINMSAVSRSMLLFSLILRMDTGNGTVIAIGQAHLGVQFEKNVRGGCCCDWRWNQRCSCFAWGRHWTCHGYSWNWGLHFLQSILFVFWSFLSIFPLANATESCLSHPVMSSFIDIFRLCLITFLFFVFKNKNLEVFLLFCFQNF